MNLRLGVLIGLLCAWGVIGVAALGPSREIFTFHQNRRRANRANMGPRFIRLVLGGWDRHVNTCQPNANLRAMARQSDVVTGEQNGRDLHPR